MNKELLSLVNDPYRYTINKIQIFFERSPLKYTPWLKKKSKSKFSIVSAVYGVEKYLDDFFNSITNQTLVFEDHIELIMVDDGSLDGSAEVIKKWAEKYPNNIHYIKKENGGQASARNLGMEYVTSKWVTFIDPDDFISKNYFATVDKFISKECDIELVSCNLIFYIEDKDIFRDSHALNYRYRKSETVFSIEELNKYVQLSANSVFFKTNTISSNKLEMDSRIIPTFEDAHFVGKYLLSLQEKKIIGFVKSARYFYRKREDGSSAIDSSWENKKHYFDKLKYGFLDLLEYALEKKGNIPEYIQRTVLYDLIWYFKRLVNNKEKLTFLSSEEKDHFVTLLMQVFSKIDKRVILDFELVSCNAYYKTGWLNLFKACKPPIYDVEIEAYDATKKQIKVRYFYSGSLPEEIITLDGHKVLPVYEKVREHDFLDNIFVLEKIMWLPVLNSPGSLSVSIGGKVAVLILGDLTYEGSISISSISDYFDRSVKKESNFPFGLRILRGLARLSAYLPGYQSAWVFIDRDTQADDNAEHLYRYIRQENPKLNLRFILRRSSHDWGRLEKDGFSLIPFGSLRHMVLIFNARHLISSHADNYVFNFPPRSWFKGILKYRYTFLQHGVIKHDLSKWLNDKPIDVFVTTSEREYQSIAGAKNTYKYSPKEVCLTGLPRHDELLKRAQVKLPSNDKRTLLIMPTWRQSLVGNSRWMSSERKRDDVFYTSEYALNWKQFLHSEELQKITDEHNLEVIFFLHANVVQYLDWFDVPSHVIAVSHQSSSSIQDFFVQASVLLTDYSSVAFEVAYLKKPVIYYQFDSARVFGGGHTTAKGYFDYEKDGFGPVCENEVDLLLHLQKILDKDFKLDDEYSDRVKKTFKYRDGKCCQRVYEAILNLENPDVAEKNIVNSYL